MRPAGPAAASNPAASSDLLLRGATLLRIVDGKMVAKISAPAVRYRREGGTFAAEGVAATLFPGPQARALESFGAVEIQASHVAGDARAVNASAQPGGVPAPGAGVPVMARAARGDVARGNQVRWERGAKRLSSTAVSIDGPGYSMRGDALEATTDGERFELVGARGTLTGPAGAR